MVYYKFLSPGIKIDCNTLNNIEIIIMEDQHQQNVINYYVGKGFEVVSTSLNKSHDGTTVCGFTGQAIPKTIIKHLTVIFRDSDGEHEDYWTREWSDGPDKETYMLINQASYTKEDPELPPVVDVERPLVKSEGRL